MPALYTMSLEEVAAELRPRRRDEPVSDHDRRIMRRTVDTLIEKHGFPRPIAGAGLVWSRARVRAWIDELPPVTDEAELGPPLIEAVDKDRLELERRYAGDRAPGVVMRMVPRNPSWS